MTSHRFVVGQTTYAVRGVTSVAIAREFIPGTSSGVGAIVFGAIFLVLGVLVLVRELTEITSSSSEGPIVLMMGRGPRREERSRST